jgi:F0F1-type ATP synthase alpha subunit
MLNRLYSIPIEKQIMVVYAIVKGYLDQIPISNIDKYEHELMKSMDPNIFFVIVFEINKFCFPSKIFTKVLNFVGSSKSCENKNLSIIIQLHKTILK